MYGLIDGVSAPGLDSKPVAGVSISSLRFRGADILLEYKQHDYSLISKVNRSCALPRAVTLVGPALGPFQHCAAGCNNVQMEHEKGWIASNANLTATGAGNMYGNAALGIIGIRSLTDSRPCVRGAGTLNTTSVPWMFGPTDTNCYNGAYIHHDTVMRRPSMQNVAVRVQSSASAGCSVLSCWRQHEPRTLTSAWDSQACSSIQFVR